MYVIPSLALNKHLLEIAATNQIQVCYSNKTCYDQNNSTQIAKCAILEVFHPLPIVNKTVTNKIH